MAQQNKKITELPLVEAADGLLTLGVNSQNESVQIPLGDLLGKIGNTKKNKDYVIQANIFNESLTLNGVEYPLVNVDWETLGNVILSNECDITFEDIRGVRYQLDHVWCEEGGLPFGYKYLNGNRRLNVSTVEDSDGNLRVVYKFNDNAVKYDELGEKPSINGVELSGNKTSKDLKLQGALRTSADLALSADDVLSLTDMAKKRLFIDLWNNAAGSRGRYNEETGYFELCEIYDIDWDEALLIFKHSYGMGLKDMDYFFDIWTTGYGNKYPRVLLPLKQGFSSSSYIADYCLKNDFLERIAFTRGGVDERTCVFNVQTYGFMLSKVEKIYDIVQISQIPANNSNIFNMPKLVYGRFKLWGSNYTTIYFRAPLLDYTSTNYLFTGISTQNANGQCVFKLAANMYNRLNGTATDYATSGGTKEEWMALADLAATKNITLATE